MVKIQKQAIKCICFLRRNFLSHMLEPICENLSILNLKKLRMYCIGVFMYKFHHRKLPKVFDGYFVRNSDIHNVNTRQSDLLHVPLFRSNLSKKFIRYAGVLCWNAISKNVKTDVKISSCKASLIQYLFKHNIILL